MKSIYRGALNRMVLAAMSIVAASAVNAVTMEEAISRLSVKDLAALRAAQPAVIEALSDASQLASEWKAGRQATDEAAVMTAAAVNRLTEAWTGLDAARSDTRWVTHQVALVVLATDVRTLMVAAELRDGGPLSEAIVSWLDASSPGLRPATDDRKPDHPCFLNWQGCMQYCSNLGDFMSRSFCGLDCQVSFISCMGGAVGDLIGSVLGSLDGSLR